MKKSTEVIAMYLPQFHRVKENDEWWGEGFTEWTNVRKARPLFKGHNQPRKPYNDDYYDLADEMVMYRQMKMAKEYGVDGFCFYHYWFNGKKLLEKPIERLLGSQNVILPYCLCWANEPWTRRWDGKEGSTHILMPQIYGDEKDWENHFDYLSLFFKQEKYIKVNGKPLFIIYKISEIKMYKQMLERWNELAKKAGYPGLFILVMNRTTVTEKTITCGDGSVDFEPFATRTSIRASGREFDFKIHKGIRKDNRNVAYDVLDYAQFCEEMVNRYIAKGKNHFLGFFAGWDNSPRRGVDTQLIFENNTPENFEKYFRIQYKKSIDLGNEFLFINAWNEWGEGTYLEPDELYKFGYLEAIKKVKEEINNI